MQKSLLISFFSLKNGRTKARQSGIPMNFIYIILSIITCPLSAYMTSSPTAIIDFLKPIELTQEESGVDGIDCIYVINLDERIEKWNRLLERFTKQQITPNRMSAVNGWNIPLVSRSKFVDPKSTYLACSKPLNGGEIGCLLSHLSVYQDALLRDFNTIWICEDDVDLQEDARSLSSLLQQLTDIDPDWDLLYTDYSVCGAHHQICRPNQPPHSFLNTPVSNLLQRTHGRYGTHSMIFSKAGLSKVFMYFCHVYLWSPIDIDIHYTPELREYSSKINYTKTMWGPSDTQPFCPLKHLE